MLEADHFSKLIESNFRTRNLDCAPGRHAKIPVEFSNLGRQRAELRYVEYHSC